MQLIDIMESLTQNSSPFSVTAALLTMLAITLGYSAIKRYLKSSKGPEPTIPCLPCVPVLGSMPFLSTLNKFHLMLTSKSQQYGTVFSFYALSQYTVVLNGYEALREALIKKSADFAGRAYMYVCNDVWIDGGRGLLLRDYSDLYTKLRSNCLQVLKTFGITRHTVMESKIHSEIEHLASYIRSRKHEDWYPAEILEHTTMNIIHNVMFNERFEFRDPRGAFLQDGIKTIVNSCEVIYDLIPAVTYIPNVWRYLSGVRTTYLKLLDHFEKQIDECREGPVSGDNFIQEYVKLTGEQEFDRRELAVILRDLLMAGTETTSGQMNWALILMANNPDIQTRIQRDIDSVVSRDRLPSWDDRIKLPYVEATILEVMRLKTAVPLAAPHVTTKDTEVMGHHIPKGTTVIVNIWSAHMDPQVWEEPEKFRPERFLDDEGHVLKRDLVIPFSLGKRQCLGEVLARQEMFLIFSALMQQFRILPPEGQTKVKDVNHFIRALTAEPHLMRIVPRTNIST